VFTVQRPKKPEVEFLAINLTKDSSLLLRDLYSPLFWRILKTLVFKIPIIKSAKQENSCLVMNSIWWSGKTTVKKTRQKLDAEKTRVYAQKP
jgi:hypothetical protein